MTAITTTPFPGLVEFLSKHGTVHVQQISYAQLRERNVDTFCPSTEETFLTGYAVRLNEGDIGTVCIIQDSLAPNAAGFFYFEYHGEIPGIEPPRSAELKTTLRTQDRGVSLVSFMERRIDQYEVPFL